MQKNVHETDSSQSQSLCIRTPIQVIKEPGIIGRKDVASPTAKKKMVIAKAICPS